MASIFLLFCFTSKSDLLKHVTRYYLPLSVDIWERTTSITKLKLSVSMQNSIEVLEKTRIEVEVIAILSVLQVYCCSEPQYYNSRLSNKSKEESCIRFT